MRFRDQSYIHQVIRRTLGDALGSGPAPAFQLEGTRFAELQPATLPLPTSFGTTFPSRWAPTHAPFAPTGEARIAPTADSEFAPTIESAIAPTGDDVVAPAFAPGSATAGTPTGDVVIRPMMALGQFRDTFIIAVDEEGIAIIDQHVAHERVLFERITERLSAGRLQSQRLLEPLLVNVSASGRQALLAHGAELERLGFEIEEFGGDTLRVSAFPALLRRDECEAAVRALAEDLEGLDKGSTVDEAIRRVAATMACHAAVKAN